jgi:hypothetical protein
MLEHLLTVALLFGRHCCEERLKQGGHCSDVLAGPGKNRGAWSVFDYLAVDLARMGTSASPAGAPPELLFECCAFLLQRSLGFFQFFLTSNETCPPLTHLLPVPSSRRRGRG